MISDIRVLQSHSKTCVSFLVAKPSNSLNGPCLKYVHHILMKFYRHFPVLYNKAYDAH